MCEHTEHVVGPSADFCPRGRVNNYAVSKTPINKSLVCNAAGLRNLGVSMTCRYSRINCTAKFKHRNDFTIATRRNRFGIRVSLSGTLCVVAAT